jgi:hypothetical protein
MYYFYELLIYFLKMISQIKDGSFSEIINKESFSLSIYSPWGLISIALFSDEA